MMLTRPSKWWRPRCSASQGARNLESTYDDRQERSSGPPHNMWDGVYLWQSRFGEPTWGRNEGSDEARRQNAGSQIAASGSEMLLGELTSSEPRIDDDK